MGLGSLTNFMLPLVYFLLLRFFRVSIASAVLGTIGVIFFFTMCGNSHRDWGNFTIMRSWQGKCILMELILPLALLYSLRFTIYGRRSDAIRLQAVMCCGMGLSGTGLFLIPFLIGTSAFGICLALKFSQASLINFGIACTTMLQAFFVSLLPWLGILPQLGDNSVWKTGWPQNFADNLGMVIQANSVPLYCGFLATSFLVKRKIEFIGLIIYLALAVILLTTPGPRNLLMAIVLPAAYWRFSYALLIPLYVGLAFAGLSKYINQSGGRRNWGYAWSAMLIIAIIFIKIPTINRENISLPGLKFPPSTLPSVYLISKFSKENSVILAPVSVVFSLGLLRPDMKFIVTRPDETLLSFTNAGRQNDGVIRSSIGVALEVCSFTGILPIQSEKLWPDLNSIVYHKGCDTQKIRTLLSLDSNWKEFTFDQYQLLHRTDK